MSHTTSRYHALLRKPHTNTCSLLQSQATKWFQGEAVQQRLGRGWTEGHDLEAMRRVVTVRNARAAGGATPIHASHIRMSSEVPLAMSVCGGMLTLVVACANRGPLRYAVISFAKLRSYCPVNIAQHRTCARACRCHTTGLLHFQLTGCASFILEIGFFE